MFPSRLVLYLGLFLVSGGSYTGLEGYKQDPPPSAGTAVGFKYAVSEITNTRFSAVVDVYGARMMFLYYNYMGVSAP